MESYFDRRKNYRLPKRLKTKITVPRTSAEIDGFTDNISQGGAFILSPLFTDLEVDDQVSIGIFLPPKMTGQSQTLILNGPAVVKRTESNKKGVAVQFLINLKAFEPSR